MREFNEGRGPRNRDRKGSDSWNNKGFRFGERKMFDATCETCGAKFKVPFEPKEGRPVYCREHYTPKPRRR